MKDLYACYLPSLSTDTSALRLDENIYIFPTGIPKMSSFNINIKANRFIDVFLHMLLFLILVQTFFRI